jgi:hypothetical protein
MGFDLYNRSMNIQKSIGPPNLKVEIHFGSVEVQFSHSPILSTSREHEV